MKRYRIFIASLALAACTHLATAQNNPPGGQNPPPPGPRPERPGGPGGGRPQLGLALNPLFRALDENKDGELSETEIANASAALRKLDLNHDGKLTRDELRPERPEGLGGRERVGEAMVQRLMSQDKNGDGKLSKEELPERMQRNFDRLDTNGDGFVDKSEIEAMANRARPEGPGGVPPRRPPPAEQEQK